MTPTRSAGDAAMSFLRLSLLQWTALAAIAGFALAAAAIATIIVTVWMARTDRKRDTKRRQEDRQWDSDRRREDREHDAELRRQDRQREDQLRREADQKWEARLRAEQRERQDADARQVTVQVIPGGAQGQAQHASSPGHDYTHQLVISAPAAYQFRQVEAQIVHNSSGSVALRPAGHSGDEPVIENGRTVIRMWAEIPAQLFEPYPIVRFTDRHDNRYYVYRQHTQRFPHNTDWPAAAVQLDQSIRTGPKPDEPAT